MGTRWTDPVPAPAQAGEPCHVYARRLRLPPGGPGAAGAVRPAPVEGHDEHAADRGVLRAPGAPRGPLRVACACWGGVHPDRVSLASADDVARSRYGGRLPAGLRPRLAPGVGPGGGALLCRAAVAAAGARGGAGEAGAVRAEHGHWQAHAHPGLWRASIRPGGLLCWEGVGMPAFPGFCAPSGATRSPAASAERTINYYIEESPNERG